MGAIIISNDGAYHTNESILFDSTQWKSKRILHVKQMDANGEYHSVGTIEQIRGPRRKILYRSIDVHGNEIFPQNADCMEVEKLFLERFDRRKQQTQELKNTRSRTSQKQTKDLSR